MPLIELARLRDLSGIYVALEQRLAPSAKRPILDAFVVMQVGGGFNPLHLLPCSHEVALANQPRIRFAIEAQGIIGPIERALQAG